MSRRRILLLTCAGLIGAGAACAALLAGSTMYYVHFDRERLPDVGPLTRFEFPTIGHVYDANGQPLIELAREHRQITQYADIPPVVRDAILAAEDKHFFSHNGVDYASIPRVIGKVRLRGRVILPQGGSTITQQLVRARGVTQGAVVVLRNRDGSILAEVGGRELYQHGDFSLETLVPDEPISVPDRFEDAPKWISNYDGRFKGLIPVREALAESRNASRFGSRRRLGSAPFCGRHAVSACRRRCSRT